MWRTHYVLHCHISWWAKGKWYCTILLATLERDSKLCSVSLQSSLILNGTGSPSQYWPILRTHLHPYLKKHMFRFNHRKGFVLHKMFLVNLCQAFQHGQGSRTGLSVAIVVRRHSAWRLTRIESISFGNSLPFVVFNIHLNEQPTSTGGLC